MCFCGAIMPQDKSMREGLFYTERQRQCCDVASDIASDYNFFRFLVNQVSHSQKWVATPTDQI